MGFFVNAKAVTSDNKTGYGLHKVFYSEYEHKETGESMLTLHISASGLFRLFINKKCIYSSNGRMYTKDGILYSYTDIIDLDGEIAFGKNTFAVEMIDSDETAANSFFICELYSDGRSAFFTNTTDWKSEFIGYKEVSPLGNGQVCELYSLDRFFDRWKSGVGVYGNCKGFDKDVRFLPSLSPAPSFDEIAARKTVSVTSSSKCEFKMMSEGSRLTYDGDVSVVYDLERCVAGQFFISLDTEKEGYADVALGNVPLPEKTNIALCLKLTAGHTDFSSLSLMCGRYLTLTLHDTGKTRIRKAGLCNCSATDLYPTTFVSSSEALNNAYRSIKEKYLNDLSPLRYHRNDRLTPDTVHELFASFSDLSYVREILSPMLTDEENITREAFALLSAYVKLSGDNTFAELYKRLSEAFGNEGVSEYKPEVGSASYCIEHVLGVKDIDRLEKKLTLSPHIEGLEFASGTLLIDGDLMSVTWSMRDGRFELSCTLPPHYSAFSALSKEITDLGENNIILNLK